MFCFILPTAPICVLDKPVSTAVATARPLPLYRKPWILDSDSAESGCFSPSVSLVPGPTTHPILGSSESWFGGGSDPIVVSRTGCWAEEDGSGFWRLSFPQLLDLPSVALPVDSPTEAPASTSGRPPLESVSPSRYLTTRLFTQPMMSFCGCQGAGIKRKTSHPNFSFLQKFRICLARQAPLHKFNFAKVSPNFIGFPCEFKQYIKDT